MAGFGGGLVQGFQVGDAARSRRVQEGRQAESDQWAREDRARLVHERDIEDQIRAAGAEAMGLGAAQQPLPVAPEPAPGVAVAPVPMQSAEVGPAERQAGPHIVGSPVERMASPEQTPVASGERMKAGALGLESNVGPGQAERAGPPDAAAAIAMPKAQRPDDYAALNRSLKAMSDKAAQLGRADLALNYHMQGMKVRDQLRQRAADAARAQYEASGDVNAFVPFVNDYMPGDVRFDSITKEGDGYILAGSKGGQQFQTRMKASEVKSFIDFVTNPDAARALEAKRAEQLYQIKVEQAKKGPTVLAPGSTAVYPNGGSFTAPDKPETKVVKNADGSESLVRVDGGGSATSIFGGTDQGQDIPKPVRDMQKEAESRVLSLNKISDMAGMDPKTQAVIGQQFQIANALIRSNYGTDNWTGMSSGLAAELARKIQTGELPVKQYRVQGIDQPVRGVEFEGRKYLLDPFVGQRRAAPAAGEPQKGSAAPAAPVSKVDMSNAARAVGLDDRGTSLALSIFEQESASGAADTSKPNGSNARGPMQMTKDTFAGLKKQGVIPEDYDWGNPRHSTIASLALIKMLYQKYDGDPRKVAAAYYSGEKAVGPNGEIRDLRDPKNPKAPTTLQYVDQVTRRIASPNDPTQIGLGTRAVNGTVRGG